MYERLPLIMNRLAPVLVLILAAVIAACSPGTDVAEARPGSVQDSGSDHNPLAAVFRIR